MYVEKPLLLDIAHKFIWKAYNTSRNSCVHSYMMNPYEDHQEHNNILKSILDQNVYPEFQVKACGAQDTWHNTIGHPTTAIWAQRLYR